MAAPHPDQQHLLAPQAGSSRPINEEVKTHYPLDVNARTAAHTHQQATLLDLPQVNPGQPLQHDVNLIRAALDRELRTVNETPSSSQETLMQKKERLRNNLRQLRAEHSVSETAAAASSNRDHQRHEGADGNDPLGRSTKSVDRYGPPSRPATSVERYVPATADNNKPSYPDRETTSSSKRQRKSPAKSDTEFLPVMADAIVQVTRLTRKIAGLETYRSDKMRKGAAEGLSAALVVTLEDLLAKANEVAAYVVMEGQRVEAKSVEKDGIKQYC
ncbi:MAG: hypothetical protein Q9200_002454 [Gallowayella weberi]